MTFRPDSISRGLTVLIFLLLIIISAKEFTKTDSATSINFKNSDQAFIINSETKDSLKKTNQDTSLVESTSEYTEKAKKGRNKNKKNQLTVSQKIININTASIQDLTTLKGIGEKMAKRIVDYRKSNGKFKSIEDIRKVKGIGEKKFEQLKLWITI